MANEYGIAFGQFETDGPFYFQFIGGGGQPLFHSQGYQQQKSCENGIRSVIENAPKAERYEMKKDEQGLYLSLKAGNHQEIARSAYLADEAALRKLSGMMQTIGSQVPVFNWTEGFAERQPTETKATEAEAEESGKPKLELKKVEPAHRLRFEVSLYTEPKKIKIENNFSKESKVLSGLNGEEMAAFIYSELGSELRRDFPIVQPVAAVEVGSPTSGQIQEQLDELPAPFAAAEYGQGAVDQLKARYQAVSKELPNPVAVEPKTTLEEKEDVVMAFINEAEEVNPQKASTGNEIRKMLRKLGNSPAPEPPTSPVEKLLAAKGRSLPTEPGEDRVMKFIGSGKNPEKFSAEPEEKQGGKVGRPFLGVAKKGETKKDVVEEHTGGRTARYDDSPTPVKAVSPQGFGCACK